MARSTRRRVRTFLVSLGTAIVGLALALPLFLLFLVGVASIWGAVEDGDRGLAVTGGLAAVSSGLCLLWVGRFLFSPPRAVVEEPRPRRKHRGTPDPEPRGRVGRFLVWLPALFLVPLFLALVVVLSPFIPIVMARDWYSRWRMSGRCFLVATRRRGWFDFVSNNVMPVLPQNVSVIWDRNQRDMRLRSKVVRSLDCAPLPRPYLIEVRPRRLTVRPLHARLLPLKSERRRSVTVQASVDEILREVLAGKKAVDRPA